MADINKTILESGFEVIRNNDSDTKLNSVSKGFCDVVSVIMTFYNAEQFIGQAVSSVLTQITAPEGIEPIKIDFVIVDDKSTDNSRNIVTDVINNYFKDPAATTTTSNISINIVEPTENLGCGGARKFGIANAVGDYFMFLDADDYYINKDFVARAHLICKKENADIVEFGVRMNTAGQPPVDSVVPQSLKIANNNGVGEISMFKDNIIKFNVWSKIYTKAIINSKEYSDSREFEDVRTVPYWVDNAETIIVINSVEINYRANSSSIIRDNIINTRLGTITAIAELFPDFANNTEVLKAMYGRAMVDITALCDGHSEENEGFVEMSELNTKMLKYIFPNDWMKLTFNPNIPEFYEEQKKYIG